MGRAENRIKNFQNGVCQVSASKDMSINNVDSRRYLSDVVAMIDYENNLALKLGRNKKKKVK